MNLSGIRTKQMKRKGIMKLMLSFKMKDFLNKIKSSFWLQFPVDEMKCLFIEKGKVLE
jgi:hypothetical protein